MRHTGSSATGRDYEALAERYLCRQGMQLVTRNYRCRLGELDLILLDGDCLVFVEVKYRSSATFGDGVEHVDARKQRKLRHTAALFLSDHSHYAEHRCRFDVVGISGPLSAPEIRWVRDALCPY